MLLLVLLPLLLSCVTAQSAGNRLEPATDDAYEIVSRIDVDDSVVAVVRRNGVLHLLYDETIIGAEFDDPYLRKQTAFPGFTIMQCAAYMQDKPTRALQIGLGIGTVPSFLREMEIPTDVVEISEAVVTQAADYFQYEWCQEDFDEECPQGRTFVMDGLKFLASKPEELGVDGEHPYDLFIVDVYTGWNPFAFFVREEMVHVRENWLTSDGVLVMNFVGYMQDPRAAAPKSIYRTLQSVFKHVKCFREMEEPNEPDAANIVFYASDKPFSFNLPSTGMYEKPPAHTFFSVVKNFPEWEVRVDLQRVVNLLLIFVPGFLDLHGAKG
ncbi:Spermine/spermidine synthase [Phytophthora palmivora]|uniref:Spermine/spermidine synthase n=1 Tax=Phytophthora palmivora TaxID=4796 RepID=A0A2P4XCX7_9STRA|nr:Spermine/spermidine synthase [Phytophthora palmivora]